jgi:hypothetical protein
MITSLDGVKEGRRRTTHAASTDGNSLRLELVLKPLLANDEDLLVFREVENLGEVDG